MTTNKLQNICVFIEDEKQLNEAINLLNKYQQPIYSISLHGVEDGTLHIWYNIECGWSTATVVFSDDVFVTLTELEKLLEDANNEK